MPVVVGVSEGEREFLGVREAAALVLAARQDGVQIIPQCGPYAHNRQSEGGDRRWIDSVIFDGSHLPFEENVKQSREAVTYARACGRDMLVEGELGMIGSGSEVLDAPPADIDKDLTDPQQAALFARETGIDLIAPAVGNMHGVLRSGALQKLDNASHRRDRRGDRTARSFCTVDPVLPMLISSLLRKLALRSFTYRPTCASRIAKASSRVLRSFLKRSRPYKYIGPGALAVQALVERFIKLFAQIS